MIITNSRLRELFVSPQLRFYFDKKLAPLNRSEIDLQLEETLKFLNMATYISGNIPVSKEIDEVWHYWILETQEYQRLCLKLPGGKFIHHTSNDFLNYVEKDIANQVMDLPHQVGILSSYVLNFGPFEVDRIKYWPVTEQVMRRCGMDVASLNAWLGMPATNEPSVQSLPSRRTPHRPTSPRIAAKTRAYQKTLERTN